MAKVKITFSKDGKGSEDGFTVLKFVAGESYEVDADLAKALVDEQKIATYTEDKKAPVSKAKTVSGDDAPAPAKKE